MYGRLLNIKYKFYIGYVFFLSITHCLAAYAQDTSDIQQLWLSVTLNQTPQKEIVLFLKEKNGRLLVSTQDWQNWRFKKPEAQTVSYDEQDYYRLDELKDVSYILNEVDMRIDMQVNLSSFVISTLKGKEYQGFDTVKSAGMYLNYDLNTQMANGEDANANALMEFVAFSPVGVFETQGLWQYIGNKQDWRRLDSVFVRDDLSQVATLRLGDVVTGNLGLATSARVAGVQWSKNFGLQSYKPTFPLLTMAGEAILPSTVDIFINGLKTMNKNVDMGAFQIDDIPILTGKGEVKMVIKDILGRTQEVTMPYYTSPNLLAKGLSDYSYEFGVVREKFASENQNYGSWLASMAYRFGLTNSFTVEGQAQLSQHQQSLMYGTAWLMGTSGSIQQQLAYSRHDIKGQGAATNLQFNFLSRQLNYGGSWFSRSKKFSFAIESDTSANTLNQGRLFLGLPLTKKLGTLTTSYIYRGLIDGQHTDLGQINYTWSDKKWGSIQVTATKEFSSTLSPLLTVSWSLYLDKKRTSSFQLGSEGDAAWKIRQDMPAGNGWGYSFESQQRNHQRKNLLSLNAQNDYGNYALNFEENTTDQIWSTDTSGSVIWFDRQLWVSRQIRDSFALVNVGDLSDITVYRQNQKIGETNKRGSLLIPQLSAYQMNKLSLEAKELPFDVELGPTEIQAVPVYRSGIKVDFSVKRSYGATLNVLLEDGQSIPAGAIAKRLGSEESFPIGYHGELYITGLNENNKIQIFWKNQSCQISVDFKAQNGILPDLGSYTCRGVAP